VIASDAQRGTQLPQSQRLGLRYPVAFRGVMFGNETRQRLADDQADVQLKPFSDAFHCHFILHMNQGCKPLRGQLACFKHEYALI